MAIQPTFLVTALLSTGLSAGAALSAPATESGVNEPQATEHGNGVHDFDFFFGRWRVHHRRLKDRLAGSHEWIDFDGTTIAQPIMGGYGNMDDNVLELPGGGYRAVTLRLFDANSNQWSIWWLDGRLPRGPLDPPVRGSFRHGVGTFYADDTFKGKPIRVRFIWSAITAKTCRWEQAFSADGGKTWETNWTMEFMRSDER
jgi:hypothetical protein